jgi:hypothetical protein
VFCEELLDSYEGATTPYEVFLKGIEISGKFIEICLSVLEISGKFIEICLSVLEISGKFIVKSVMWYKKCQFLLGVPRIFDQDGSYHIEAVNAVSNHLYLQFFFHESCSDL